MAKKQDKTDEQILKEIIDRIGKRVTSIESELKQFIELKAWEVGRLEKAIIKLAKGMDAVYGHNEAARAAVAALRHVSSADSREPSQTRKGG